MATGAYIVRVVTPNKSSISELARSLVGRTCSIEPLPLTPLLLVLVLVLLPLLLLLLLLLLPMPEAGPRTSAPGGGRQRGTAPGGDSGAQTICCSGDESLDCRPTLLLLVLLLLILLLLALMLLPLMLALLLLLLLESAALEAERCAAVVSEACAGLEKVRAESMDLSADFREKEEGKKDDDGRKEEDAGDEADSRAACA
jgi:hypothetical protein